MKKMKLIAGCLAAMMALGCVVPAIELQAGRRTEEISDSFDNASTVGEYDSEIWSQYSEASSFKVEELTAPDKVLQFKGKNVNSESTVLMSKEWYWEIHSLTFDMKIPKNGSWMGLDFVDIDEPEDYLGDYQELGEPMCYGSLKVSPDDDFGLPSTNWKDWGFASNELSDTWVSVKIVSDSDRTGKIYLAPKGKAFDESKGQNITLSEGQSFHNSNIVFADYAFTGYMLDNIVIKTDTGTYKEDFNDEKDNLFELITYREDTQNFSTQIVEDGAVRKLSIANAVAGDRIIANTAIKNENEHLADSDEVLRVSYTINMSGNNANEELAFVFGLPENDSNPFADTWGYVMSRKGGRLVRYDSDGAESVKAKHNFRTSMKGTTISLSVKKDGSFQVSENGSKVLNAKGVSEYQGYAGFAAKTDIAKTIQMDNVVIANTRYHVITTKTFSDDFSTNRLGSIGNSDYAYHAEAGSITVSNGELAFNGCLDDTYFGAAYEYETYEMTFRLTSILGTDNKNEIQDATYLDRWIGIDFGKQSSNMKSYGSYGMFLIRITAPEGELNWKTSTAGIWKREGTSTMKGEEYTEVKPIPASYFKDITYDEKTKQREDISPDAAVCFKLVAETNQMKLYMKRADQKDYTLHGILKNVNPEGYAAITCTGWTYWTIDNFEMKNTAKVFKEAPEVVIEEAELVSYEERGLGVKDTYWAEEQKLNQKNAGLSTMTWVAIGAAGVIVVAGGATALVLLKRKKSADTKEAEK